MSRDLNEGDYYTSSGGLIPVKWTAPEALHYKKYSTPVTCGAMAVCCMRYGVWDTSLLKADRMPRLGRYY